MNALKLLAKYYAGVCVQLLLGRGSGDFTRCAQQWGDARTVPGLPWPGLPRSHAPVSPGSSTGTHAGALVGTGEQRVRADKVLALK